MGHRGKRGQTSSFDFGRRGPAHRARSAAVLLACAALVAGAGVGPAAAAPPGAETGSVTTGSIADGQDLMDRQAPPGLGSSAPQPSHVPPDWAASTLPTPISDDAFFDPPGDIDALAPGSIIRSRPVALRDLTFPATEASQIMVRSNDSHDRPIAGTATLIAPAAPWAGPGPRPLLVNNQPINSLGAECTPGYKMLHDPGGLDLPPLTSIALWRGYAVLIPDHEGPRMAYAAGRLAGHIVLDSIRGIRQLPGADLSTSPVALIGYSGGAIATGWAAQLAPGYAPELELAGVAAGGTPADLDTLAPTMDGTLGSGLYAAASFGLSREYPELLSTINDGGRLVLQSELRNVCSDGAMAIGAAMAPLAAYSFPGVQDSMVVQQVFADTRLGDIKPTAPVLLYHGSSDVLLGDEFIPESEARALWRRWCALGANVQFEPVAGEHMTAEILATPMLFGWLAARFAGEPTGGNCPR